MGWVKAGYVHKDSGCLLLEPWAGMENKHNRTDYMATIARTGTVGCGFGG